MTKTVPNTPDWVVAQDRGVDARGADELMEAALPGCGVE
jgi:hypothetical protein